MAFTTFSNGTVGNADEVNANFLAPKTASIYTSTGLNATATGTGTSGSKALVQQELSYEMTAITAAAITSATYLRIKLTGLCEARALASDSMYGRVEYKIQEKYTGGAYADALAYTGLLYQQSNTTGTISLFSTVEFIYTLTANDYSNGCQIKLFVKASGYGSSGVGTYTLTQASIEIVR